MAVTKAQLANWSKEYEANQNKESTKKTNLNNTTRAGKQTTATQKVSRAQLNQWSAEYESNMQTSQTALSGNTPHQSAAQTASPQGEALAAGSDLYATAMDDYRAKNNLGFADAMDSRSDMLNRQEVPNRDVYRKVNDWKDASDRNRQLARLVTEPTLPTGAVSAADLPAGADYLAADTGGLGVMPVLETTQRTDDDLKKLGYTQAEINQARNYLKEYSELSLAKRAGRRVGKTVISAPKNLAGGVAMDAGALPQAMTASPEEQMIRRIQSGRYTDEQLEAAGYAPELIQTAHQRIADGNTYDKATDDSNPLKGLYEWGRDTHKAGEEDLADAMRGESNVGRFWHGAATSAAENLVLGATNPALVLPVLSAQGAGDSMAASDEAGESPEKALVKSGLKFGAGWAINSVGVADLAKTMGSDYAKDTVAGTIADWVRKQVGNQAFREAYPAIANAISGGADNAMQAFVETYADKAIDAVMGDQEAAKTLFNRETLLSALEAGLSGGAAGAMGGAAGTGLAMMRGYDVGAAAQGDGMPSQSPGGDSSPKGRANASAGEAAADGKETSGNRWDSKALLDAVDSGGEGWQGGVDTVGLTEETQVNDDPAEHTAAQNVEVPSGNAENATRNVDNSEIADKNAESADNITEIAANTAAGQTAVENAGESVESSNGATADGKEPLSQRVSADSPPSSGALGSMGNTELTEQGTANRQVEGLATEDNSGSPMRETYGLEAPRTESQKQARTEQALRSWKVGEKAAQEISLKQPEGVDSDRYAAAASTLYRLGQMEDVKTFDQALELAGTGSGMAANVNYVLGNLKGRNALEIAYTYGKDAVETRWAESQLGGNLTEKSLTGRGETIYKGTLRNANDAGSQVIELNAAATGTTAVMKNVLMNHQNVKAYVETETARIFFGDSAQDTFGTVLHEDYHWYNALDSEGAKALQDHALLYLAKSSGFETVDEMIREKMADYAQQNLTYEEAAEELVGDAWRGIFSDESDFKRWVEFQRGQAEKNRGKAGTIRTVMNRVKEMLGSILSRAKEVLEIDPDNRAALKAKRLAENERKILQDEYFAHAEKAMDNLRSAKENAAALKTESAAEGRSMRFQLHEGKDSLVEQMNSHLAELSEMSLVAVIQGNEVSFGENRNQSIQNIADYFDSIGNKAVRDNFGVVELLRKGARTTIQHGNSRAKQAAVAAIPAIIEKGQQIGFEKNWQERGYDTYVFAAPVEINGVELYESVIINSYHHENRRAFYVHEVCWSDGSYVTLNEQGVPTKKEDTSTQLPKAVLSSVSRTQEVSSDSNIAQTDAESKRNSEPVKKSVRFQLDSSFARNVDELDVNAKWSKRIRVGSTSEVLKSIGVKDQDIYWDSGKIRKILQKHSAENFRAGVDDSIMTKEIIKQVPQVLENPIVVLHSDTSRNEEYASRIYMFGEVYDQTGKPVDVSLELLPTNRGGLEMDNIVVTSAYGKKNVQGLLNRDQILYIDPNKNRTDTWLAVNRLQLPLRITRYGSIASLHYAEGDVKSVSVESDGNTKDVRFQLAEQADRDAKKNTQRQASRAIADNSIALETLGQMMGVTRGVRISQDSIDGLALRWTKTNGSRADRTKIAGETRALVEYMEADGADMNKVQSLAETISTEILDGATYRNTELWDAYPEYHDLSYTVNKDGPAKAELVKRYGTWSEAVAEARRHGVKLRQAEGMRDGNPAEMYESIVNDTRAMGSVKDGAAALFRGAAQAAGVDGAASMESTEWLDVLMNVHDTIKPRMMSRFADAAEYEDAKVELAGRMIGDILNTPEMSDAQAIFDGFQRWQRQTVAAAVGEENADQALKDLRKVQKEQSREFNRRLYENSRNGSQNEAVQRLAELQKRNEKAEKLLDENLDALGLDISNYGDMAEKLDVLKEAYEREWKAERKRLREERQQMLDEIRLENKQLKRENWNLSYQVAGEQRRADRAEWQLIHQENELMEWEQENQRKAQEWQEKQAERNAIAVEVARQQRDEDIAIAKKLAEKRVQKAREGRQKDELKRAIRANAAQLNQMILRPSKDRYVQPRLIQQAAEVAKLADQTLLNDHAVARLTALRTSIMQSMGAENSPTGISEDWKQSKVPELIDALQADLTASKQAKLDRLNQQLTEAEALGDSEKAEMLRDRLRKRIRETENRPYLPMTVDQMRMLKAITSSTLHVIRTANKTLSLQKAEAVDKIANEAAGEITSTKGNEGKLRSALTRYNLDMLGATRVFRMLGGYKSGGQMEKLAAMLNEGQRKQTRITVEGTKLFDNVTGKGNLKQMEKFAGPGAELVDIGLKDSKGRAVPLTHAQLCSLYMHLQNADSREHLLNGGLTVPDAEEYNRGDIEKAYQKGQTVKIGMLTDSEGKPMADTVIQVVENAMTDYDRAWCEDMKQFFGSYTTNLINETSMKLLGYQRATVKNYYPIEVDKTALATQIEGVKLDATIEGRGFLKNRVKSQLPILLEECSSVVQRSLRDTAAYAGLAAPIRDVQKVLNSGIETEDGIKMLKNGILKEQWGQSATNYIDDLLTDLQTTQRRRSTTATRVLNKLRGNYAGAILTLNPGVAIAQAASLPTAGAVLGADTMAAVVPFVKNFSGKQRAALEREIAQHGDVLLQYRMRGSQRGELASVGVSQSVTEKAMDALPKGLTGWINSVDEITVAALWEGSKRYVEHHANEFAEGAATKGSEAYWEAVNQTYQRVIEETQPNYTTMQRAGIQRNPDQLAKTLTMFTTQRFQNYGILADAVMDYNAQKARYKADQSAENKAELTRAGRNLKRAAVSQITQTAVFALMKIGADFLLHRWDREQDENGDITAASMAKRFASLFTESAAGNFLYGSELYGFVNNVVQGNDYDVVSASNLGIINDISSDVVKLAADGMKLLSEDTADMSEEELDKFHQKLMKHVWALVDDGFDALGVPMGNADKFRKAVEGYLSDIEKAAKGEGFSFNSLPSSATGQYDRLYNAIAEGDKDNAAGAMEKLEAMGKDEKTITSQLTTRLKKYSPEVKQAAKARNEGNDRQRRKLTEQIVRDMYETLGIREGVKADAEKRAWVIDLVTGAIDSKADELLAGGTSGSVYDTLTEALDTGRAKDVQDEIQRLRTAGKEDKNIKNKITDAVKEEYLAGNDHDRAQLEKMLLKLTKADGSAMYEEKNFAQWVKDAAKKEEQAKDTTDEWAGVR